MAECSGGGGWRTEGGAWRNGINLISQKEQKVLGSMMYIMVLDQETLLLHVILIKIKDKK